MIDLTKEEQQTITATVKVSRADAQRPALGVFVEFVDPTAPFRDELEKLRGVVATKQQEAEEDDALIADLEAKLAKKETQRAEAEAEAQRARLSESEAIAAGIRGLRAQQGAEAKLARLVEVLQSCAKTFRDYETIHLAKKDGGQAAKDKAEANRQLAIICERVIENLGTVPDTLRDLESQLVLERAASRGMASLLRDVRDDCVAERKRALGLIAVCSQVASVLHGKNWPGVATIADRLLEGINAAVDADPAKANPNVEPAPISDGTTFTPYEGGR